ncbi:MAG: transglycosylase SLT domain-containing protein [Chloroflexota bacterium]
MALNNPNYQTIYSPLNEQFSSEPTPTYIDDVTDVRPFDSVQYRMKLIFGFAVVAVFIGILFVASGIVGNGVQSRAASASNNQSQSSFAGASFNGISPVFSPEVRYWEPQILAWSQQYGVDANLIATIMQIESCGDPGAASGAGAQGLFQVMPFHFTKGEDMLDPNTNAMRGINYFAERLVQTDGNIGLAFAGYNGGHVAAAGGWDDWVPETQRYFIWSTGIFNDIESGLTESPTLQKWMVAGGASLCQQASSRLGLR